MVNLKMNKRVLTRIKLSNRYIKKNFFKAVKNSLFLTMFRNYAFIMVTFAVLTGVIFMQLYSSISLEANKKSLLNQASSIAKRVGEFVEDDDYITYPSFLEVLEELGKSDIWIIQNPDSPMNEKYTNTDVSVEEQPELIPLLSDIFSGRTSAIDVYSETYGTNYIFSGAPIIVFNRKVVGAVLVNQVAESQQLVVRRSFTIIIISTLIALLISLFFAIFLARRLSRPISIMRETAIRLAKEDYDAKTNIKQDGELGELASSIDSLSHKLREARIQRNNLEQMRLDFFANVSHELRTPITVVRAYTESLLDGIVSDDKTKREYYNKMLNECKSMERLVGDLLILSKMQNPDFSLEKEPINIIQVFSDLLRSGKALADQKDIRISLICKEDVILVNGDYDRIRQMFMIIIDNAIKFSKEDDEIKIKIERIKASKILIEIRDYGCGISSEELPFIFDKFYKSKLRQNAKGSGLGLAIARQIAIKHGWQIRVVSKLQSGTSFFFELDEIS